MTPPWDHCETQSYTTHRPNPLEFFSQKTSDGGMRRRRQAAALQGASRPAMNRQESNHLSAGTAFCGAMCDARGGANLGKGTEGG
jgi:hypothetical protein